MNRRPAQSVLEWAAVFFLVGLLVLVLVGLAKVIEVI